MTHEIYLSAARPACGECDDRGFHRPARLFAFATAAEVEAFRAGLEYLAAADERLEVTAQTPAEYAADLAAETDAKEKDELFLQRLDAMLFSGPAGFRPPAETP